MPDTTGETEEPGETQTPSSRYWLTNDMAAGVLVLGTLATLALAGAGVLDLSAAPENWRFAWATAFLIAVAWLFGSGAASSVLDRMGGGGGP